MATRSTQAHEILNDYDAALRVAVKFLEKKKGVVGAHGVSLKACLEPLEGRGAFGSAAFVAGDDLALDWVDEKPGAYAVVRGQEDARPTKAELFSDDALDVLALLFAVVKILYLGGGLARATALIAALEPTRRGSAKALHETTIRNEHAYYCCVAQILAVDARGPPPPFGAPPPPGVADVYVCGDSHALAPAWKTLDLGARGIARLRPALVTGLKHWHLRAEGSFYPKRNFYAVVGLDAAACSSPAVAADLGLFPGAGGGKRDAPAGTIPRGATVLFVLGEIDCREGILVAVEKLRYPDVDAGIAATAAIFVDKASKLCKERGYAKGLVHPVPPVLDETRDMVKKYNAVLRALVEASDLVWLDFFDGLLDETGLKPGYCLDGTHLHPTYLDDLLAPALADAL